MTKENKDRLIKGTVAIALVAVSIVVSVQTSFMYTDNAIQQHEERENNRLDSIIKLQYKIIDKLNE